MKALFLESRAARQIREYCLENRLGEPDKLLEAAYENGRADHDRLCVEEIRHGAYEDWWVNKCLLGDKHKVISINELMRWDRTPEGHHFWNKVWHMKRAEQ